MSGGDKGVAGEWLKAECAFSLFFVHLCSNNPKGFKNNKNFDITIYNIYNNS